MLILKGFAVYEEAAVVVEVDSVGVLLAGGLRRGWRNGWSQVGRGSGVSLTGGRCGGIELRFFAALRMTGGARGCGGRSGCGGDVG
jgi:hypothetical protein